MKRLFLFCFLFIFSLCIYALPGYDGGENFTFEGISYYISYHRENGVYSNVQVQVVYNQEAPYSGEISIPDVIDFKGETFPITTIMENTFENCTGLTVVTIGKNISHVSFGCFRGCSGLVSVKVDPQNSVYDSRDNCNAVIITASNTVIAGCKTSVIPNNIKSIGSSAFLRSSLTSITIPESVTSINSSAFEGSTELSSVEICNGVTTIGSLAFGACYSLKSVTIPNSVVSIGSDAFSSCNSLTNVYCYTNNVILDSEKSPFERADLSNCSLHAHDALLDEYKQKWPGFKAYKGVDNTDFNITYYVDGEEYKVVKYKYDEEISPESFPVKKGMTFSGWSEIPETMPAKDIEVTGTFNWSTANIDNIIYEVKDTVNNYAYVKDGKELSGEVKVQSSVEFGGVKYTVNEVAKDAFYWDTNVFTSVVIPDGVTTIGSWAFKERKSLKKVEIGSGITSIGKRAFADIDNLETVTIHAENVPETDRTAFENSYLNYVTLYVPASSLGKYKDAAPWNEFKDIVALDEEADDNLDVITIKDIGKTTYCCEYDLDFTDVEGIKAYTATGYDNIDKTIWLTRVMKVPAGTGILVKGDAGTYKVPRSNVDAYYTNMFKGNTGDPIKIEETDGDMTNYYLSGSDGQFKSVNGSANIGKNKAYLQLPTKFFAGTRSIGVTYDDEGTTGIWTIEQGALKSERDVWFNLQGQRVEKPRKGLYIRNGKKVVVR